MIRTAAVLLMLALGGGALDAGQAGGARPRPQPRVDPLTAAIEGRVTTADTGAPIRRAEVRAITDSGFSRMAVTDPDGRFELRDMPAGRFRLNVTKSGFVPLYYGQRRPFEAAVVIPLAEGQRVSASVALPRGSAIAGRVYDEAGEPLAYVRVQALRLRVMEGRRRLLPVGPTDVTGDTGAYRVYGLPPGEYYVSARPEQNPIPAMPAGAMPDVPLTPTAVRSTMTMFYPGTANVSEAQRVVLDGGSEARADIQIVPLRGALVSGVVLDSSGAPAANASITLSSDMVAVGASPLGTSPPPVSIAAHSDAAGAFQIPDVPPGPYSVRVSTAISFQMPSVQPGSPMPPLPMMAGEFADSSIVIGDADLGGLTLTTGRAGTLEGEFVADAAVSQPLPTGLGVEVRTASAAGPRMMMSGANGSGFRIMAVPGQARLDLQGLPEGWAVKAILVDDVDVTDQAIDIRNGRTASLRVILTDRVTQVTGTIADLPRPTADADGYKVVVFPEDASKWIYPSRYLRTVRTDEQGRFRITALPPNQRYFALAVDYLEEGEGTDPEFLERFGDRATAFTLGDAEQKVLTLRPVQR